MRLSSALVGLLLAAACHATGAGLSGGDAQQERDNIVQEISLTLDSNFDASNSAHQDAVKTAVLDALAIEGDDIANYDVSFDAADTESIVVTHILNEDQVSGAEAAVDAAFNAAVQTALQSALGNAVEVTAANATTIRDIGRLDEMDNNAYNAIDRTQDVDDKCLDEDGAIDGYSNGQGIEMDYTNSKLKTEGGNTVLELHFKVPARYAQNYGDAAFAITFHDRDTDGESQDACFTNKDSYNNCATPDDNGWSRTQWEEPNGDTNACFYDYTADFAWSDIFGGLFRDPTSEQNGAALQVVITADVERWTTYQQVSANGRLDHNTPGGGRDTPRTQGEWSDIFTQDSGATRPDIYINSERYEFSQIPFILSFQNQVTAEASLQIGSPITMIAGVVKQDLVAINMNPEDDTDRNADDAFAQLDVTVRLQTQYPFAVQHVGMDNADNAPIVTVVNGDNLAARGIDDSGIDFVKGQDASQCRNMNEGDTCAQELVFRVYPANCNSASGEFQLEFWVKCIVPDDGCPIDAEASDGDLEVRKTSNAYNTINFKASTGNFCPVVLDEYKIDATLKIYKSESYEDGDLLDLDETLQEDYIRERSNRDEKDNLLDVTEAYYGAFSNDFVYLRAEYYAYTDKKGIDKKSKDEIDFARATSIHVDAKLPLTDLEYRENYNTATTLNILARDGDIVGDFDAQGNVADADSDGIDYRVYLCGLDDLKLGAEIIQEWGGLEETDKNYRSLDCFTADPQGNALDLLDFAPSYDETYDEQTNDGPIPTEKEIRFRLRLDERIFPMNPVQGAMANQDDPGALDDTHTNLRFTVESEIYYRGNRQPTRRRLQAGGGPDRVSQNSVSSNRVFIRPPQNLGGEIKPCMVNEDRNEATLVMWMSVDSAFVPEKEAARDWETNFAFQIANIYGNMSHEQIKVLSLTTCESNSPDSECRAVLANHAFRRLESARLMRVKFQIHGDDKRSGAYYLNRFQELVVNPERPLEARVSIFKGATVHEMSAMECGLPANAPPRGDMALKEGLGEESAAPRALAWLAGLFALVTLWL